MCLISWLSDPLGFTENFSMVLNHNAVMQNSHIAGRFEIFFGIKTWGSENNIVSLPNTRFARGVNERNRLFVNRTCLAIGVSFVLVRVENLYFITLLQEDTAVVARLTDEFFAICAINFGWSHPLEVNLRIAIRFFGANIAGLRLNNQYAISDIPLGFTTVNRLPLIQ